jgi:NAD(P)-dependent dehydrogenase (short-subunit alcohol dehydrogenase family)
MGERGRVAVVTGAGSGIGRAVARAFLQEGWAVALAGRRQGALEETVAGSGAPAAALPVPTDVRDPSSVEGLFARTRERFGRVDLIFVSPYTSGSPCRPRTRRPSRTWRPTWSRRPCR